MELGKGSTRCHRPGTRPCRNGAQLLELGKAIEVQTYFVQDPRPQWSPAFGAGKRALTEEVVTEAIQLQWSPAFGAGKRGRQRSVLPEHDGRNGAQLLELGKVPSDRVLQPECPVAAMEPSFWSWEKDPPQPGYGSVNSAAMEPSFWSWEKGLTKLVQRKVHPAAAMEPSFWSWEKVTRLAAGVLGGQPQWSPAFGAGKRSKTSLDNKRLSKSRNGAQLLELGKGRMRPLRWQRLICRNGAQLLELGKAPLRSLAHLQDLRRNGAQLLELGKVGELSPLPRPDRQPQWSPAFGAGKSRTPRVSHKFRSSRNGAQLLELGKEHHHQPNNTKNNRPQWSPAFGAGKSYRQALATILEACRNGAQLLELGKAAGDP